MMHRPAHQQPLSRGTVKSDVAAPEPFRQMPSELRKRVRGGCWRRPGVGQAVRGRGKSVGLLPMILPSSLARCRRQIHAPVHGGAEHGANGRSAEVGRAPLVWHF
jgi:hypothetical protein